MNGEVGSYMLTLIVKILFKWRSFTSRIVPIIHALPHWSDFIKYCYQISSFPVKCGVCAFSAMHTWMRTPAYSLIIRKHLDAGVIGSNTNMNKQYVCVRAVLNKLRETDLIAVGCWMISLGSAETIRSERFEIYNMVSDIWLSTVRNHCRHEW